MRPESYTRPESVAAFRELAPRLNVAYRDEDGAARLLYFDRQYNDTLGLIHEDALDVYVGDTQRLRRNIASAVKIVEGIALST